MPTLRKEFLDIQATIECGFTLKRVCDMIRRYSQMHRTDKYWEHSSIIWSVWPNGWVFVYELSGSGFESSCSHLIIFLAKLWDQTSFQYSHGPLQGLTSSKQDCLPTYVVDQGLSWDSQIFPWTICLYKFLSIDQIWKSTLYFTRY